MKLQNHYNCPIVATYPEVIANNMDELFREEGVVFSHPLCHMMMINVW